MEIFTIFPSWFVPTTLSLSIFFWIFLRRNRSTMVVVSKLPPTPPKLPIIGNLHQLLGKPRHQALSQLSHQYGPLMLLHIGTKPYLVISSSHFAKQIFKTQDHIFCSRPISHATKRLSYNYLDIAFSPYNNHWRKMRKLLVSELLGPKRAKVFNHLLGKQIETMVRFIDKELNNVVNLNKLLLETVKGAVCKVAFGNNYREEPIKGPSWEVMLNETVEIMNGSLGDSFPWLGQVIDRLSGWNSKLEKCFTNIDSYIETIIDEQSTAEKNDVDKGFLHTLVDLYSKDDTSEEQLTKGDIKALVMDVLTGGIDTTVVTMVWAMSEIIRSGRVMQKLQSEIRNCTGRKQKVEEVDITKMSYLKMVVKETLRLHPPAPLLIPHESISHCKIGGYEVVPGTSVLINGWAIGRDPNTWGENTAEFYPERFENLEVDYGGGNFEMVPFGGGRRSCPAMNTAPATIELTIANLLYWFDWDVGGGEKKEDLNMVEEGSLVVRKKLPLCLVPTKQTSTNYDFFSTNKCNS